jgi:hypothetical protein
VGGGIVVVPLLILIAHFSERPAMGPRSPRSA